MKKSSSGPDLSGLLSGQGAGETGGTMGGSVDPMMA